jgi:lipopolysaccharide export system permease protein
MLNIWQIDSVADTTNHRINRRINEIKRQSTDYFFAKSYANIKRADSVKSPLLRTFYDSLSVADKNRLVENALNIVRSNASYLDSMTMNYTSDKEEIGRYLVEWHRKIVVCFACIILFFIGAPLGAIIKKGGLGVPVIVAVFFFLAYFILTEAFTSLAYEGTMPVWQAMWMPLLIFLPISIFLTYKAAKDSAIFDITSYYNWFIKLFKKNKKIA